MIARPDTRDRSRKPLAGILAALIVSGSAVAFIGPLEGNVPRTYRDAIDVLTSCRGHTGPELRMGQTFTPAQCDAQFGADVMRIAKGMAECVDEDLTNGEALAYLSMAFNVGTGAFCSSTLVRKLNDGDHAGACKELARWVNAGGHRSPGLVTRRATEQGACERGL